MGYTIYRFKNQKNDWEQVFGLKIKNEAPRSKLRGIKAKLRRSHSNVK
jgi:hypothetical protein